MEDPARKWVYYRLSWKGKSLLHPESATFGLMLVLSFLGVSAAMVALGNWLKWWALFNLGESSAGEGSGTGPENAAPAGTMPPEESDTAGSTSAGGAGGNDTQQAQKLYADAPGDDSGDSGGGFFGFLSDENFWLVALLTLLASILLAGAVWVRVQGRKYRWSPLMRALRENPPAPEPPQAGNP